MELFGLDIVLVLLTAGFIAFWGMILILFVLFYDKNPYVPRKYYKVKVEDKDGTPIKTIKAWIITKSKVKWLRIGFTEFPSFKGVEKDIAVLETINKKGEIEIIEDIPSKYEPENYTPKNIPITQIDAFILDEKTNIEDAIIMALGSSDIILKGKDKDGNDITMLNKERLNEITEQAKLKASENISKRSRIVDLNTSRAAKEYISQARREAERNKSDDFIYKYGPILSLIVAGLFAYLILDSANKSFQATMAGQNAVMENGYNQVIQQCGGVYHSLNPPANTTAPAKTGVQIPFVNG